MNKQQASKINADCDTFYEGNSHGDNRGGNWGRAFERKFREGLSKEVHLN